MSDKPIRTFHAWALAIRWWPAWGESKMDATAWLYWHGHPTLGVRFGRKGFRLFSERHQGTRGIPIRHHYLLGQRVTIIQGKPKAGKPNG